ncbi:TRAFAC clade GTPase domain-containing protein [Streptomyces celluloflavus]|uniref:TRAFAC clade GTPase domain-containing protein n=1 Tax=Streptomyces celluloflavus TaxID=58344 RepID=UPI0036743F56
MSPIYLTTLALWIIALVAAPICLYTTLRFLGLSLTTAGRTLGPWRAGALDARIPGVGAGEPTHRAYWSQQMWLDARDAAGSTMETIWHRLTLLWLHRYAKRLLHGRRPTTGQRGENWFTRTVLCITAPGTASGAALGALLAALLTSVVLLAFGLLLGMVWLLAIATVAVLRGTERLWLLVRGIRMKCPYPGCYRPFPLAVHRCPSCGVAHGELRPGRYGTLWHICVCGQRLVTTSLAGRGRLATRCPHCDQQLPEAVGSTRVVHLPLVGGTSSGKTMVMAAMVAGLQAWSRRSALTVEYASAADRNDAGALNQLLNQTGWALKTQGGEPRAFMLRIGYGRRHRLLYLYDPMGESLHDAGSVRQQQYLAHADGVVLVADVLAEPQVRRALRGGDAERATAARPSDQSPLDTYQRLTGELAALTGRRRRISMATVVTKRDVLDQIGTLPVPGARIDSWLEAIGLGALVRGVGHDFGSARYWAVSAYAATGVGALESEQRRAAEPVLWILAHSGLRVGAFAAEPPEQGVPRPRSEAVADRSTR